LHEAFRVLVETLRPKLIFIDSFYSITLNNKVLVNPKKKRKQYAKFCQFIYTSTGKNRGFWSRQDCMWGCTKTSCVPCFVWITFQILYSCRSTRWKKMLKATQIVKPRGQFLTSPLGAKFDPRGEFFPLEVKLCPGGEILWSPLHSSKQLRVFTPGVNEGVNIPPRGQSSPLEAKFTPRGEVRPWGPRVKLRMALSDLLISPVSRTEDFEWKCDFGWKCHQDFQQNADLAKNSSSQFVWKFYLVNPNFHTCIPSLFRLSSEVTLELYLCT
jgi:hypothetical protein